MYKRQAFLRDIGYILDEGDDFEIETDNVDEEIAQMAGPQLVVPVMNARYALNAANARWGSLYDALYGTDVIPEGPGTEKGNSYNPARGDLVIAYAARLMNEFVPLASGQHEAVTAYAVVDGQLQATLGEGDTVGLARPEQLVGYRGEPSDPASILFNQNGLHMDIQIDRDDSVGALHSAGVKDIVMESAVSTIQDCEDSVAAVDAEDKAVVYGNWCGLMKGDLVGTFNKSRGIHVLEE